MFHNIINPSPLPVTTIFLNSTLTTNPTQVTGTGSEVYSFRSLLSKHWIHTPLSVFHFAITYQPRAPLRTGPITNHRRRHTLAIVAADDDKDEDEDEDDDGHDNQD